MRSRFLLALTSSFFVVAGAVAGLGATAAPASAAQRAVDVPAESIWTDTGLDVTTGQPVHLSATGIWGTGVFGLTGPDGYSVLWGDNFFNLTDIGNGFFGGFTLTDRFGALIGFVGPQPPGASTYGSTPEIRPIAEQVFLVGSDLTFTPEQGGRLWLGFNSDAYSGYTVDNSGSVHVTIDYRAPTICVVTGLRAGPPKQQDVTVSDLDGGARDRQRPYRQRHGRGAELPPTPRHRSSWTTTEDRPDANDHIGNLRRGGFVR